MIRELHFNQAFEDYMKHAKRLLFSLMAAAGTLVSGSVLAVNDMVGGPAVRQLNFQQPVTSVAADVYELHIWMIVICVAIFIAVFGVMFYSILKHRQSLGHKAASFHESTTVEIAWTVVPFVIVVLMALPATKTVVAMKDTSNADITIKATGMQWKWGYDYLKGEGEGIAFLSALSTPRDQIQNLAPKGDNYLLEVDHPLVVPVNKKIRIVTTANDVIHMGRARLQREAGCDPRFRPRHLVQGREDRYLPRQLLRAVRQRTCVHAHRSECGQRGGLRKVGG